MRIWTPIILLAAAWRAQADDMLDYRIRGYIEHRSTLGGSACANTSITACARQGRLLLRASPTSLKVDGPPTGFAVLNNKLIDCPTGVATIKTDASGNNAEADGTFPADRTNPALIPPLPFVVTASGEPNGIQIRTLGSSGQCIYGFQLMQATSYILGVQPVAWISIWGAAGARLASAPLLLACSLGAVVVAWALR
ncbi:hypothetical protein ABPG77_004837 [Micractinium sp. CCAP 211/92]